MDEMGPSSASSICVDVVRAIAAVEGTTPRNLDFTLHEHIYTPALNELYRSAQGEWRLDFEVPGHEVTVQSDGRIIVDDEVIQQDS